MRMTFSSNLSCKSLTFQQQKTSHKYEKSHSTDHRNNANNIAFLWLELDVH